VSRHATACAAALAVVVATLVQDALSRDVVRHARPVAVLMLGGLVAAALLVLAPRVRSWTVAAGAGIAAGGAIATLVTGAAWSGGVPDPIVRGGVAFNLADVAIAAGDALLLAGALVHAWANRARLRQPA
jgi:lipoprotein signal peptidase